MRGGSARTEWRRLGAWALTTAVVLGGSVAVALAAKKSRGEASEGEVERPADPEPYLRVDRSEAPRLRLEVALRKFEPSDGEGPAIWLAAVTHLGEPGYYEALQEHLDARGLVLYEGVGLPGFLQRGRAEDAEADRIRRTREALRYAAARLHGYRKRHGSFPPSLDVLRQELVGHNNRAAWWLKAAMTDAWGNRLRYEPDGDSFVLRSLGRDGEPGGMGPDAEIRFADQPPLTENELNPRPSIQAELAEALGLVFQFDGLDYDRTHFRHSDLSMTAMRRALAGHPPADAEARPANPTANPESDGESGDSSEPVPQAETEAPMPADAGADDAPKADGERSARPARKSAPATAGQRQFRKVARLLDGSSLAASLLKFAMGVIDAHPRLRAITRLLLIETLGQLEGDLAQARGLPAGMKQMLRVLIHERNRAVVDELERALEADDPPGSISVLYGAGHMPDLEARLRDRLGYRPADQRWLRAFSVDREATGLGRAQVQMLRSMIRMQMKTLGGP